MEKNSIDKADTWANQIAQLFFSEAEFWSNLCDTQVDSHLINFLFSAFPSTFKVGQCVFLPSLSVVGSGINNIQFWGLFYKP